MNIKTLPKIASRLKIGRFGPSSIMTVILLAIIVVAAFWVRSLPARFGELGGLDEFYIFRMSEYVLTHNWQMPDPDLMRHHPFGARPILGDPPIPYYLPAAVYVAGGGFGMTYLQFALIFPAIMGALAVLAGYFLGKIVRDRKTGLLTAFFMAVIPAFLTRTIGGSFEKEGVIAPFIILCMYFFIRSYKGASWKRGALCGVFLVIITQGWGGYQYFYYILTLFTVILLLLNQNLNKLLNSYIPMYVVMMIASFILPYKAVGITSPVYIIMAFSAVMVVSRFAVEKYGLIRKEKIIYFVPACFVVGVIGLLLFIIVIISKNI